MSPLPILTQEYSFYQQYKIWIWSVFYLLIFSAIILRSQIWKFRINRKKAIRKVMQLTIQQAEKQLEQEQYQKVGVTLLGLVDKMWMVLTGTSGREMDKLLEKCPPSIQKEVSMDLKNFIQNLERLSFAPKHTHSWSKQEVKQIIQNGQTLIEKILTHYQDKNTRLKCQNHTEIPLNLSNFKNLFKKTRFFYCFL